MISVGDNPADAVPISVDGWVLVFIQVAYFVLVVVVLIWCYFGIGVIRERMRGKVPEPVVRSGDMSSVVLGVRGGALKVALDDSGRFICGRCGHRWKSRSSKLVVCPRCKWREIGLSDMLRA